MCLSNMTSFLSASRLSFATGASLLRVRSCRSNGVAVALTRRRRLSSSNRTTRPAESSSDVSVSAALPIPDPRDQKVLHVAVAGLPNAGKSTLLNYMVGDKVRQSTRVCECKIPGRNVLRVETMSNISGPFYRPKDDTRYKEDLDPHAVVVFTLHQG